jgi:TetR/AcrR family acrAB operon transcriptional repressor
MLKTVIFHLDEVHISYYNAQNIKICAMYAIFLKERPCMSDNDERKQQILDGAAAVIIQLGYDKTTMSDIAEEAGASRRTVYQYFNGKEELFEALLYREYLQYAQTWLEFIEADPRGGTIGGFYRAIFHAVNSRPLIAAMLRHDRRVIGNYLRKRNNIFTQMVSGVNTAEFFQALQTAGAIRQDIDAAVILHIVEMLSYGQLTIGDFKPPDQFPPYDAVMEALADMMDRALLPQTGGPQTGGPQAGDASGTGGSSEAGKAIVRQITAAARAQMEQIKQARERSSQGYEADPT